MSETPTILMAQAEQSAPTPRLGPGLQPADSGNTSTGQALQAPTATPGALVAQNPLLEQLHDIELPEVSGGRIAPGFLALGLTCLLLSLLLIARLLRRRTLPAWRETARREHQLIRAQLNGDQPDKVITQCSTLLRRAALALQPRHQVANLTGNAWLSLLDGLHGSTEFTKGAGRVLASGPYENPHKPSSVQSPSELQALVDLTADFIRTADASRLVAKPAGSA